jgi:hypothetical protein
LGKSSRHTLAVELRESSRLRQLRSAGFGTAIAGVLVAGHTLFQCMLSPNKRLRAWTGCQLLTIESMYTTSVFQNMCCLRGGSRGSRESPADPDVASSCLLLEALPMVVWLPMAQVLRGFQYTTQDVVRRESFKLFYIYSFCFF